METINITNTYLKAFILVVLVSAAIHVPSRIIHTIRTGELNHMNYFSVIEIDLLFPQLADDSMKWISLAVFLTAYVLALIYVHNQRRSRQNNPTRTPTHTTKPRSRQ